MKVLLIAANTERINMVSLPLGLAFVAAALERHGHEVELVDLLFEEDSNTSLRRTIENFEAKCIGISVRNIDDQVQAQTQFLLEKVKDVVALCRAHSKAPIVLGGAGYSIFPQAALDYLQADYGIQGEGEFAFLEFIDKLAKKAPLHNVAGLYVRGKGLGHPRHFAKDPGAIIFPDPYQLAKPELDRETIIPVQARRGCPFTCTYCSTPQIEGRNFRKQAPAEVAEWLSDWVETGFGNFFFVDNVFNYPPDFAKEICRKIIAKGLDISWNCIIYPKKVDAELAGLMARAGCTQASIGFESGSDKILAGLGKKYSIEEVREVFRILQEYQIQRMGFLLFGAPGETKETVLESLDFADSLRPDTLKITIGIRIYPQTELADIARQEGVISRDDNLRPPDLMRFYHDTNS